MLHALLNIEVNNELFSHPIYGNSFESYVIENICDTLKNWNHYFYRTQARAELDLVLEKAGRILAIEIKSSTSPKPSRGFWSRTDDIKVEQKYIIAPVEKAYPIGEDVTVTNVHSFLFNLS